MDTEKLKEYYTEYKKLQKTLYDMYREEMRVDSNCVKPILQAIGTMQQELKELVETIIKVYNFAHHQSFNESVKCFLEDSTSEKQILNMVIVIINFQ